METISIFDYSDYRTFLNDLFEQRKSINKGFTLRYIAQKTGVSHTFFKMILNGKRNLSNKTIPKVISVFNLSQSEEDYFEALVHFNQSDSAKEKTYYFEEMLKSRKQLSWYQVTEDKFSYFDEWYHPVIREVVTMEEFTGDYKLLGRRLTPPISSAEAKESVDLLCRLGFLEKVGTNSFKQAEPVISSHGPLNQARIITYQIKILESARESMVKLDPEKRYTSTLTLGISPKTFKQIVTRFKAVKEEIIELAHKDTSPEMVYQMIFHTMPVLNSPEDMLDV